MTNQRRRGQKKWCLAWLLLCLVTPAFSFKLMLISRKMEKRIGEQSAHQIAKQAGIVRNKKLLNYIDDVAEQIVYASRKVRQDMDYRFGVLRTKEVNALSTGPVIFITAGMWQALDTEDELAFVLGHEVAHSARQHQRKAINRALIQSTFALFLPEGELVSEGIGMLNNILETGWSRSKEMEADRFGLFFMVKAGYNPKGALSIMKKLAGKGKKHPPKILLTHPPAPERRQALLKQIKAHHWNIQKPQIPIRHIVIPLKKNKKKETKGTN